MMVNLVRFTSIQAPNQDFIGRAIASFASRKLGLAAEFAGDIAWQEREAALDAGRIQVGWICGYPYVRKVDRDRPLVALLAAPVMQGSRYGGRPVYFSDVVVRQGSPFRAFADLRGVTWAYNEPNSHSGSIITRYTLAEMGETTAFFGRVVEAGSHQNALQMVLNGAIDASAIDSTVLALEMQKRTEIKERLRIIASLGPSPIPPWVVSTAVDPALRQVIQTLLLSMHQDPEGQAILANGLIDRFVEVSDADYDPIRQMARKAAGVGW